MVGKRILLMMVGLVFTGLGVLGVWLPGLPTTPFILLALWAFSRSSPRMENWLRRVPLLGSAVAEVDRYHERRDLPMKVKVVAQAVAWGSAAFTFLTLGVGLVLIMVVGAATGGSVFMTLTPTRKTGVLMTGETAATES